MGLGWTHSFPGRHAEAWESALTYLNVGRQPAFPQQGVSEPTSVTVPQGSRLRPGHQPQCCSGGRTAAQPACSAGPNPRSSPKEAARPPTRFLGPARAKGREPRPRTIILRLRRTELPWPVRTTKTAHCGADSTTSPRTLSESEGGPINAGTIPRSPTSAGRSRTGTCMVGPYLAMALSPTRSDRNDGSSRLAQERMRAGATMASSSARLRLSDSWTDYVRKNLKQGRPPGGDRRAAMVRRPGAPKLDCCGRHRNLPPWSRGAPNCYASLNDPRRYLKLARLLPAETGWPKLAWGIRHAQAYDKAREGAVDGVSRKHRRRSRSSAPAPPRRSAAFQAGLHRGPRARRFVLGVALEKGVRRRHRATLAHRAEKWPRFSAPSDALLAKGASDGSQRGVLSGSDARIARKSGPVFRAELMRLLKRKSIGWIPKGVGSDARIARKSGPGFPHRRCAACQRGMDGAKSGIHFRVRCSRTSPHTVRHGRGRCPNFVPEVTGTDRLRSRSPVGRQRLTALPVANRRNTTMANGDRWRNEQDRYGARGRPRPVAERGWLPRFRARRALRLSFGRLRRRGPRRSGSGIRPGRPVGRISGRRRLWARLWRW